MKLKNYQRYLKENITTTLYQPTDEEIQSAEEYLEKGKDPAWDWTFGYFYIDVSGKFSVYYTLWRQSKLENHFITNLSTDFNKAIEKAKLATGRVPVIIDKTGTKAGLFQAAKNEILSFGKYRGKTLGDIFVEDPQYILWLSKDYSGRNDEFSKRVIYYKDLYFETLTKKNIIESKSQFVGNIGETLTLELNIYNVETIPSNFGNRTYTTQCKLIDENENKFLTYNIGKSPDNTQFKKGDSVILTAKVKEHKERVGIKFTILYYCKVQKKWNLDEESSKYNI